jgi:hypothetical protein
MSNTERFRCPYRGCGFEGTDAQVDDHRTTRVHDDQLQAGSNIRTAGPVRPARRDITFRTEHQLSRDDLVNLLARRGVSLGDWSEESPHRTCAAGSSPRPRPADGSARSWNTGGPTAP